MIQSISSAYKKPSPPQGFGELISPRQQTPSRAQSQPAARGNHREDKKLDVRYEKFSSTRYYGYPRYNINRCMLNCMLIILFVGSKAFSAMLVPF